MRQPDELLVTALKWTAVELSRVRSNAIDLEPTLDAPVRTQLEAVSTVLSFPPLRDAPAIEPTRPDLLAIRREGYPWSVVAAAAEKLRLLSASPKDLAHALLMPDPELQPRLFHLAVFGLLLVSLKSRGNMVISRRPIARTSRGPVFEVRDGKTKWDLWFEGRGIWSYYGYSSPYLEASAQLQVQKVPLSPDIVLLQRGKRALILECKYSRAPSEATKGVQQTIIYAAELLTDVTAEATSRVIVPTGTVNAGTVVPTSVGVIGISTPEGIDEVLSLTMHG